MDGQLPIYRGIDQQIPYITQNGDLGYEPLERIETLLSPTLFCLPKPAVCYHTDPPRVCNAIARPLETDLATARAGLESEVTTLSSCSAATAVGCRWRDDSLLRQAAGRVAAQHSVPASQWPDPRLRMEL